MRAFETLTAIAAPYPFANVDTDRIIRIERCARASREEMGNFAFEVERFDAKGGERADFVLHREPFHGAEIFVAGENFGCGSSREQAVWALAGLGIRCVIAPSFGAIFHNNCVQNGVLPIRLPARNVAMLLETLGSATEGTPERATLTVDLRTQRIEAPAGVSIPFDIDSLQREALLEGLDPIALTLKRSASIDAFQARQRLTRPWVWEV